MKKRHLIQATILGLFFSVSLTPVCAATDPASMPGHGPMDTSNMDKTKNSGDSFMQSNKNKKNVVTLPSGLQYEVITSGTGKKPGPTDMVTVDYEGRLINGEVFDSSYKRGQPATFPVNGVIAGWTEALQLMNTGSTWMLYIPPTLAYGEAGAGGLIGPNETLVFKVHLISVK